MLFTLLVRSAPYSRQSSATALRFAKTLLENGHQLHRVFFYGDGVHTGSALAAPQRDQVQIGSQWQTLIDEYQLDAVVCIAAALERGVLNTSEAKRHEKPAANLADQFELSGLGQLVEATINSDRVITFGGE